MESIFIHTNVYMWHLCVDIWIINFFNVITETLLMSLIKETRTPDLHSIKSLK